MTVFLIPFGVSLDRVMPHKVASDVAALLLLIFYEPLMSSNTIYLAICLVRGTSR
jgi:hypothetical protein